MTGNKITLYKVPWAQGNIRQPYFLSDTARDTYFENLEKLEVNKPAVNIKLQLDLGLHLIIDVDYTVAYKYNFVEVIYNNEKFYADIIDSELISFNRTAIYCRRSVVCENINFLSYFKRFNIYSNNFIPFSYSRNTSYILPKNYRTFSEFSKLDLQYEFVPGGDALKLLSGSAQFNFTEYEGVDYMNFIIIFSTNSIIENDVTYINNSEPIQYSVFLIPIMDNSDNPPFLRKTICPRKNATTYPTPDDPLVIGEIDCYSYKSEDIKKIVQFIDALSPNIVSSHFIKLPVAKMNFTGMHVQMLPMASNAVTYTGEINGKHIESFSFIKVYSNPFDYCEPKNAGTNDIVTYRFDRMYYKYHFESENAFYSELFSKKEIYFLGTKLLEIENKNFTGGKIIDYTIDFLILLHPNSSGIGYKITSELDENILPNNSIWNILPIDTSSLFTIPSDVSFSAENKYYDVLATNGIQQYMLQKESSGIPQIISGALQGIIGMASTFLTGGLGAAFGLTNLAMGAGNVMRGIGTEAEMNVVSKLKVEQAHLEKLQDQSKPDKVVSPLNAGFKVVSAYEDNISSNVFTCIDYKIYNEDYILIEQDYFEYGLDCDYFANNIVIENYNVEKFYIRAKCEIDNVSIQQVVYNSLINIINNGCTFFVVK